MSDSDSQAKIDVIQLAEHWGIIKLSSKGRGEVRAHVGGWRKIHEVRSGAIMPDDDAPGFFALELNTASGLRKFCRAKDVTVSDVQSDGDPSFWGEKDVKDVFRRFLV